MRNVHTGWERPEPWQKPKTTAVELVGSGVIRVSGLILGLLVKFG